MRVLPRIRCSEKIARSFPIRGEEEGPSRQRMDYAGYVKGMARPWSQACHRMAWYHMMWLKHWVTGQNVGP